MDIAGFNVSNQAVVVADTPQEARNAAVVAQDQLNAVMADQHPTIEFHSDVECSTVGDKSYCMVLVALKLQYVS